MKKKFALMLALILMVTAGCSQKTEQQPAPAPETTAPAASAPAATLPETTPPETTQPMPALGKGVVQGNRIPAIVAVLNRGELVEVTGYADDTWALVKTDRGEGMLDKQLLRFAGEEDYQLWQGYARYNTKLYPSYELVGEPLATLKTNTVVEVIDELEDCYVVRVDEQLACVQKEQISKYPIRSSSSSGSSGGGSSHGGGGGSSAQDGGNIYLSAAHAEQAQIHLLAEVTKTGSAQLRADNSKLVLAWFGLGDTVQLVEESGFAPEMEGYLTIYLNGVYAYIPQLWVLREGDPDFEQWDGFAGYGCKFYDNYLLSGKPLQTLYVNKPLTVLWTAGDVSLIRVDDTVGFAATDTLRTTRIVVKKSVDEGGSSGSSGGRSGSGGVWTPAVK